MACMYLKVLVCVLAVIRSLTANFGSSKGFLDHSKSYNYNMLIERASCPLTNFLLFFFNYTKIHISFEPALRLELTE